MTPTVTEVSIATIVTRITESRLDLIVIVLLIFLLVQKELVRAHGGPRSTTWVRTLDIAIIPLLLAFAAIVVMYLVDVISLY